MTKRRLLAFATHASTGAAARGAPDGPADHRRRASPWNMLRIPIAVCGALIALALFFGFEAIGETGMMLLAKLALVRVAALALMLLTGVMIAGPICEALLTLEAVHKSVFAVAVLGPFAFAQLGDPGSAGAGSPAPGATAAVRSGVQFSAYGGGNSVYPADIILKQPQGTDMVLKEVPFHGRPGKAPPYYGLRATYWTPFMPALGVMIDFTHAKAISDRDAVVEQTGRRDGSPVPGREKVSETFTKFEYSHGLNFLTLNAVYRFDGWHRRVAPYFGGGIGILIPHTEISRDEARSQWTYRYEFTGLGAQALAGLEWRIFPRDRFSAFTEYKFGYAMNHTDLVTGGSVDTRLFAHQWILGFSAYLWRAAPSAR